MAECSALLAHARQRQRAWRAERAARIETPPASQIAAECIANGKFRCTAPILRAIIQNNFAAHVALIDSHDAYAPAFGDRAEAITQHTMHLSFWMLTFEELIEVPIGSAEGRTSKVEILLEPIPLAKARNGAGRSNGRAGPRRSPDMRFTVDTPVPYRISHLTGGTHGTRRRQRRHRRARAARRHAAPRAGLAARRAAGTGGGRGLAFRGAATLPDKLQR